ncbi:2-hydroxyacid dehydrogenase [Salinibacillus xinjiangensis]|uniref:Bifunctional glyoxylate/hydroxypyruvate reductase B n=1 Tax=Salinibacillus xinjiangensis TaxID=1229268 RepID=A0A6G1X1Z8_9BACI|nr:D-glycerate dehydrogenase [Salinibacillus xinjiangensis]MRG84916.1 bifunctional glyoxylate/hydroxypyruvate reductase B [Salinibacillus xinjiangensis]
MKPKILINDHIPEAARELLKKECTVFETDNLDMENEQHIQMLQDIEGIIGPKPKITEELLKYTPMLKVVSTVSVGYDNFDIKAMTDRKVIATNTPGVLNETTADTIFGLLLTTARRFSEMDSYVKQGHWTTKAIPESLYGVNVHGKTLGIVGLGGIGEAIAKRANKGFDMNILYHNRSRNAKAEAEYGAKYLPLDDLLRDSDFVCVMTPLTPETKGLFGEREFRVMKPSAIFVNGSRGEVVNEAALYHALHDQEILAAGLDVYSKEPIDTTNPLLTLKNIVTFPHIGSRTLETREAMGLLATENLLAALRGERPPNAINQEVFQP